MKTFSSRPLAELAPLGGADRDAVGRLQGVGVGLGHAAHDQRSLERAACARLAVGGQRDVELQRRHRVDVEAGGRSPPCQELVEIGLLVTGEIEFGARRIGDGGEDDKQQGDGKQTQLGEATGRQHSEVS
ncbi:hypothetical protein [Bradyrhizobium sp. S3.5.5]|uniref:hypothetical protein n=1 Tax=Bradyrhizobium sp. S3.5.5 TaxID=3156430 RepID=UPI0033922345